MSKSLRQTTVVGRQADRHQAAEALSVRRRGMLAQSVLGKWKQKTFFFYFLVRLPVVAKLLSPHSLRQTIMDNEGCERYLRFLMLVYTTPLRLQVYNEMSFLNVTSQIAIWTTYIANPFQVLQPLKQYVIEKHTSKHPSNIRFWHYAQFQTGI